MSRAATATRAHARAHVGRAVVPASRSRARSSARAASSTHTAETRGRGRGRRRGAGKPSTQQARSTSRVRRDAEARCRSIFTTAAALMLALTSLGLARVAVIARAAEVTIHADTLAERIKEERVVADQLEVDRSSLAAPSRIQAIAADTMSMGDPASVSYVTLPASGYEDAADGATALESGSSGDRLAAVMSALASVSAGEAQSLLVGDLGLAGSR